jgi:hypothetical protein
MGMFGGDEQGSSSPEAPMAAPQASSQAASPASEPSAWMTAFDKSEESKTPLGLLLKERMAEASTPAKGSDWQERLGEMLFKGGQAMTKAGGQPGANIWSSLAQGISGGAAGYRDLKQAEKQKSKSSAEALRKLQTDAAKLASPKKGGKSGKGVKFNDLMRMVKDSSGGILDTDALRKTAVEYGHQIKDDPFGSAYLQQMVKELAGKAQSGEITDEEKADLESLMKIFEDVQ